MMQDELAEDNADVLHSPGTENASIGNSFTAVRGPHYIEMTQLQTGNYAVFGLRSRMREFHA